MRKFTYFFIPLLFFNICYAQVTFPNPPNNNVNGSSVKSKDGVQCNQGTKTGPAFDMGVAGTPQTPHSTIQNGGSQSTYNLYARVIIPLGNTNQSIDCLELYNLEIERLRIELERLRNNDTPSIVVK